MEAFRVRRANSTVFFVLYLFITDLFSILNSLLPPLLRPLPLPIQQFPQLLSSIKHPIRTGSTGRTGRILPISLQSASFAEIMATFRDNGIRVRLLADDARKRYPFQHGILIIPIRLRIPLFSILQRDVCPLSSELLALGAYFPVPVKLPALLVVFASVEKFAAVAKSAAKRSESVIVH